MRWHPLPGAPVRFRVVGSNQGSISDSRRGSGLSSRDLFCLSVSAGETQTHKDRQPAEHDPSSKDVGVISDRHHVLLSPHSVGMRRHPSRFVKRVSDERANQPEYPHQRNEGRQNQSPSGGINGFGVHQPRSRNEDDDWRDPRKPIRDELEDCVSHDLDISAEQYLLVS